MIGGSLAYLQQTLHTEACDIKRAAGCSRNAGFFFIYNKNQHPFHPLLVGMTHSNYMQGFAAAFSLLIWSCMS